MAAGPDFSPFFQQIAFGGVVVAVFSIAAGIAVVLVARTGVFKGLMLLRQGQIEDAKYRRRYEREQKNAAYRQWKKSKGY